MTKKQKVLSAICEMNINKLREILPNDRTFMDVDKELFLSSLSGVFFKFRIEGDNRLTSRLGKCRTNCCSKEFCGGYKLEGNNSSNFLNLIFLGSEEDISDIFVCNDFEGPDCDYSKKDFAWEYEEDQKVEYQATVDCIIMKDRIGEAMTQISIGTGFLTLSALEAWYLACEEIAMTLIHHGSQYSFQKAHIALKYPGGVEQFKMDYTFDTVENNREDKELISFAQMNSDDFELGGFLDAGFQGDTKDGFVVFSTDFVIVNRYGGRTWDCPWLEDNGVFFWHVDTSPESKQEAQERCECFVNQIVEKYGSYENWSNTIY